MDNETIQNVMQQLTVGIEVEGFTQNNDIGRGESTDPMPIAGTHTYFGNWSTKTDCSVHGNSYDDRAMEWNSPIMQGLPIADELEHMSRFLQLHEFKANDSCGIHVHIGFRNVTNSIRDTIRIATYAANFSHGLYAAGGSVYRLTYGNYCRPFRKTVASYGSSYADLCNRLDHNKAFSFASLPKYGTVEFRFFRSDMSAQHLQACVALAMGTVAKAILSKKMVPVMYRPHGNNSKNEPFTTEAYRVMMLLGLTPGAYKKTPYVLPSFDKASIVDHCLRNAEQFDIDAGGIVNASDDYAGEF